MLSLAICPSRVPPMFPGPMSPTDKACLERKKRACSALRAFLESWHLMTALMFVSLEPWAMAITFTEALPKEEKNLPATPAWPVMRLPTAARIAKPGSPSMLWIRRSSSSWANSLLAVSHAFSISCSGTAKQMEYSLEAWLMRMTEMEASRMAEKRRLAMPMTPLMPAPSTLIRATLWMMEKPFTLDCSSPSPSLLTRVPSSFSSPHQRSFTAIERVMAGSKA